MDTSILEDLGLTEGEIKVYMALLELGSSSAGDILVKSNLQNSVTHRALNSLIEKGLINFILEGKKRIYQATDPEQFFNFIDDKKERFKQILPELKKKQLITQKKENASIYKGIKGIKEVYQNLRDEKADEYISFGGGSPCEKLMGTTWWTNHHLKRIENNLKSRQIFDETVKKIGKDIDQMNISKVRFLPKEFEEFQETVIVGELVAITIFTDNPYSILIRDKVVAEGYKKHFEILWNSAKE